MTRSAAGSGAHVAAACAVEETRPETLEELEARLVDVGEDRVLHAVVEQELDSLVDVTRADRDTIGSRERPVEDLRLVPAGQAHRRPGRGGVLGRQTELCTDIESVGQRDR